MTSNQEENFAASTALVAGADGTWTWAVPDGWQQGRGAFGGLVLGALVRAAQASEPEVARRPRVVSGELCGPALPGPAAIVVRHLRRGNGVTYAEARASQGDELIARASVVLAGDRKVLAPTVTRAAPDLPPWSSLAIADLPSPPGPTFTRHVAFRPSGALPFTSGAAATATGHVGWRVALPALDAPAIVGLLDCWWPAIFAAMAGPRPMATVAYTAELIADPATLDASAPLAYVARVDAAAGGYVVEQRELWQGDRLVALNQQTFAILA